MTSFIVLGLKSRFAESVDADSGGGGGIAPLACTSAYVLLRFQSMILSSSWVNAFLILFNVFSSACAVDLGSNSSSNAS